MNAFLARNWSTLLLFIGLALIGAAFLALVGIDALEGRNNFQFFADSTTYLEAARGDMKYVQGFGDMISVGSNFLGPLMLLLIVGENYYAVLAVNSLIMFLSVTSIAKSLRLDPMRYALLLLINPLTFSSMLSVNKEVISVACMALLLRAWGTRSAVTWIFALGTSILVRWQLSVFVLTLLAARSHVNLLRRHRWVTLSLLLVAISVAYALLADFLEPIRNNFEAAADEYQGGSGLYESLMSLQESGLYWLVFAPKAAHLLFAMGLRFDRLFSPTDYYNDVWQLLHSTSLLLLFFVLLYKAQFRLRDDLIFMSVIYIAVFAITPIYTPRYFYPVYLIWAAVCLRRPGRAEASLPSLMPAHGHPA